MDPRNVTTYDPEHPLPPIQYVNMLIKLVQEMAPKATQQQWKAFGITARNIELSHKHLVGYIVESFNTKTGTESLFVHIVPTKVTVSEEMGLQNSVQLLNRLENCGKEIEALEKMLEDKKKERREIQTDLISQELFGAYGTGSSSSGMW